MTEPRRPVPIPTPNTEPYWAATRRGELLYSRCGECRTITAPPPVLCPTCMGNDLQWERSSGRGVVYSFTVVHRQPVPGIPTPFVLAIVELEEGWQILTHVVGCDPATVRVDMAVVVDFEPIGDDAVLPVFRPVEVAS